MGVNVYVYVNDSKLTTSLRIFKKRCACSSRATRAECELLKKIPLAEEEGLATWLHFDGYTSCSIFILFTAIL